MLRIVRIVLKIIRLCGMVWYGIIKNLLVSEVKKYKMLRIVRIVLKIIRLCGMVWYGIIKNLLVSEVKKV